MPAPAPAPAPIPTSDAYELCMDASCAKFRDIWLFDYIDIILKCGVVLVPC